MVTPNSIDLASSKASTSIIVTTSVAPRVATTVKPAQSKWVPKASLSNSSTSPPSSRKKPRKKHIRTRNCPVTLRWIPKVLLEAQGYYDGNCHIWVPKCRLTHFPSPVQDCPSIPISPILVDDRGKGKLVDHDPLDLELTPLLKSYPTYPSSSERGETSEASSSSSSPPIDIKASPLPLTVHSLEILEQLPSPIVNSPSDSLFHIPSWDRTLPPLQLEVATRVLKSYLPVSPPVLDWTNWFQQVTTSFQKV